jgi:hypothetical protein
MSTNGNTAIEGSGSLLADFIAGMMDLRRLSSSKDLPIWDVFSVMYSSLNNLGTNGPSSPIAHILPQKSTINEYLQL